MMWVVMSDVPGQITCAATRFSTRRAMLKAVGSEVFGLAGDGLPSMRTWKSAQPERTETSCTLCRTCGSAIRRTLVRSKPAPARATVAATLAFCG
jgi:hypothetical protein